MEATGGLEPPNKGFADLSLSHLGTSPKFLTHYINNIHNLKADLPACGGLQTSPLATPARLRRVRYVALKIKERETGFEPATPTLARLCSTN
jgi:hypothetical protein